MLIHTDAYHSMQVVFVLRFHNAIISGYLIAHKEKSVN